MDFLFVYGTLMKHSDLEIASFLHRYSTFFSSGYFNGILYNVSGYPGAVYLPDTASRVYGTILKLHDPKKILSQLDEYEEVGDQFPEPNEYVRLQIPIQTPSGNIACWVYLYNWPADNLSVIASGNYGANNS